MTTINALNGVILSQTRQVGRSIHWAAQAFCPELWQSEVPAIRVTVPGGGDIFQAFTLKIFVRLVRIPDSRLGNCI